MIGIVVIGIMTQTIRKKIRLHIISNMQSIKLDLLSAWIYCYKFGYILWAQIYWKLRCTGGVRIYRLKKSTLDICASLYILYNVI